MFNLSFGELLIIGTVGILVIGPARLPETARFLGHFIGRIQRQVTSVKADIKREMALEDMKSIHRDYEDASREVQNSIRQVGDEFRQVAKDATDKDTPPAVADKDAPPVVADKDTPPANATDADKDKPA